MNEKDYMLEEESLFDDFVEDTETEESIEDTPTSDDTPIEETSNVESTNEPFITIKYNSEEKGLTKEEAITMAQKGMNYDKVNTNYTNMKTEFESIKPMYEQLSKLAEESGMDVASYMQSLQTMQTNFAISREIESLKEQFPNADEKLLEELAKSRVADSVNARKLQTQQNTQKEDETKRNEIKRQLEVFERRYPKVNPQELDQKVYDLMDEGLTLLEAYQEVEAEKKNVEVEQLRQKDEVNKKNKSNATKGLGNVSNVDTIDSDDFLSGFNS